MYDCIGIYIVDKTNQLYNAYKNLVFQLKFFIKPLIYLTTISNFIKTFEKKKKFSLTSFGFKQFSK